MIDAQRPGAAVRDRDHDTRHGDQQTQQIGDRLDALAMQGFIPQGQRDACHNVVAPYLEGYIRNAHFCVGMHNERHSGNVGTVQRLLRDHMIPAWHALYMATPTGYNETLANLKRNGFGEENMMMFHQGQFLDRVMDHRALRGDVGVEKNDLVGKGTTHMGLDFVSLAVGSIEQGVDMSTSVDRLRDARGRTLPSDELGARTKVLLDSDITSYKKADLERGTAEGYDPVFDLATLTVAAQAEEVVGKFFPNGMAASQFMTARNGRNNASWRDQMVGLSHSLASMGKYEDARIVHFAASHLTHPLTGERGRWRIDDLTRVHTTKYTMETLADVQAAIRMIMDRTVGSVQIESSGQRIDASTEMLIPLEAGLCYTAVNCEEILYTGITRTLACIVNLERGLVGIDSASVADVAAVNARLHDMAQAFPESQLAIMELCKDQDDGCHTAHPPAHRSIATERVLPSPLEMIKSGIVRTDELLKVVRARMEGKDYGKMV